MSGESASRDDEGILNFKLTRRQLLTAAAGAALASVVVDGPVAEFGKPNIFKQMATELWEAYERDPDGFRKKHPYNIEENLVAGSAGVNLREAPSARSGGEGISGHLDPNEPVGIALSHPDIKPDPFNGSFLAIKRNGQVFFVARKDLLDPNTDTVVRLTNKP